MLKESYELFEIQKEETIEWFNKEIAGLRTGRVKPDLIATTPVEAYGSKTPLNGLASVNNTDPRTLVVAPWDRGVAGAIVKALTEAEVGATPTVDGEVIRMSFPALTQEMRDQTIKMLNRKEEEAKVRLRQARDENLKKIREAKEQGNITEDDYYEGREKLDQMIAKANEALNGAAKKKEEDIRSV